MLRCHRPMFRDSFKRRRCLKGERVHFGRARNREVPKTVLNGAPVSNIILDTSQAATDTINYVATDQAGLTATSTRTVIVSSLAQVDTASTTPQ
jgi:hypothetical protein